MSKFHWKLSDHGCGRFSVQIFDTKTGKLVSDETIVKDINGWRCAGQKYSEPQHKTPRDCAEHWVALFCGA